MIKEYTYEIGPNNGEDGSIVKITAIKHKNLMPIIVGITDNNGRKMITIQPVPHPPRKRYALAMREYEISKLSENISFVKI